ncbi:MAG TPA: hypothetical protein VNO21_15010 [Polyangiaceae bacterium]|nr:hypothetical protein [Polyangiaceae bacterium]
MKNISSDPSILGLCKSLPFVLVGLLAACGTQSGEGEPSTASSDQNTQVQIESSSQSTNVELNQAAARAAGDGESVEADVISPQLTVGHSIACGFPAGCSYGGACGGSYLFDTWVANIHWDNGKVEHVMVRTDHAVLRVTEGEGCWSSLASGRANDGVGIAKNGSIVAVSVRGTDGALYCIRGNGLRWGYDTNGAWFHC